MGMRMMCVVTGVVASLAAQGAQAQFQVWSGSTAPLPTSPRGTATWTTKQDTRFVDSGLGTAGSSKFGFNAFTEFNLSGTRNNAVIPIENNANLSELVVHDRTQAYAKAFWVQARYGYTNTWVRAHKGSFRGDPQTGLVSSYDLNYRYKSFSHQAQCLEFSTIGYGSYTLPSWKTKTVASIFSTAEGRHLHTLPYYSRAKLASYDVGLAGLPLSLSVWVDSSFYSRPLGIVDSYSPYVTLSGYTTAALGSDIELSVSIGIASAGFGGSFDVGRSTHYSSVSANSSQVSGRSTFDRTALQMDLYVFGELFGNRKQKTVIENVFSIGRKSGTLSF